MNQDQNGKEGGSKKERGDLRISHSLKIKNKENFCGRYKILDQIGRGGMGIVFRARDGVLKTDVALKMICPDTGSREEIKREIHLAREITHENVLRIHDCGENDGIQYISMQYVSGRNLKEIVTCDGALAANRVLVIIRQVIAGLMAAHARGIVHHDLKPQNILLDSVDRAYIADFGLARSVYCQNTTGSRIAGSPDYVAPERWRGEAGDHRSDIYSLGAVLYELAVGSPPFQAGSDFDYMIEHFSRRPRFPEKNRLPRYLKRIILRCLEKDPADRYQNLAEIKTDIEREKARHRLHLFRFWRTKSYRIAFLCGTLLIILISLLLRFFFL